VKQLTPLTIGAEGVVWL